MKRAMVFLCLFCMLAGQALAAAPATNRVPTNIKSAQMNYDADRQTVTFTGKVHVTRPDFQLWSEKLTVFLDKSNKSAGSGDEMGGMGAGDIKVIVAEKNVHIKSEQNEAHCQKGTFTVAKDEFKLEGNPRLRGKDNNTVTGNIIYHYVKENRSVVSGGAEVNFLAPDNSKK
jgi:Uncharacterized protein conserved in bacteria